MFKKIVKWIKARISNPKKDVQQIVEQLTALKGEMKVISKMPNQVQAVVRLFQVISPIQDAGGFHQTISSLREKNYGQLDSLIETLCSLQKHFARAGRAEFGWNRTKVGEEVTAAKVFLGDVFGMLTKTAEYFLAREAEMKKAIRQDLSKDPQNPVTDWYVINDYQAGDFVKSHSEPIINYIKQIISDPILAS